MSSLDPWIIDEIKKREKERREKDNRIPLELPLPESLPPQEADVEPEEKKSPTVIDISGDPDEDEDIDGSSSQGARTFSMYLI